MSKITVKTLGDDCFHCFQQEGRSFSKPGKSYLAARFICKRCGKIREFAVGMSGFWLAKARKEGDSYV